MGSFQDFNESDAGRLFQEAYQKHMRGELEDAIVLYKKSLSITPSAEAHTFLGWAYSMRNLYDEAIEECEKAIRVDPEFGNPYNDIGAYLIEKGQWEQAVPWFEKAIQSKRYDAYCYPYYNLGRVWEQKGDWSKALSYYQKALSENTDYVLARKAINHLQGLMN